LYSCCYVTWVVEWLRLALTKGPPTEYVSPSPNPRTKTDPVSETLFFLVFRIPDDGRSPETQWISGQSEIVSATSIDKETIHAKQFSTLGRGTATLQMVRTCNTDRNSQILSNYSIFFCTNKILPQGKVHYTVELNKLFILINKWHMLSEGKKNTVRHVYEKHQVPW
jgi:hypothetical protein